MAANLFGGPVLNAETRKKKNIYTHAQAHTYNLSAQYGGGGGKHLQTVRRLKLYLVSLAEFRDTNITPPPGCVVRTR